MLRWLYFGLDRVPKINTPNSLPKYSFSIVIALRNEADNLPNLLSSLSLLNYPNHLFEILFVDDGSTDSSEALLLEFIRNHPNFQAKILTNERRSISPKKDAINMAVQKSTNDWIVTTDADCTIPENWLHAFNTFIDNKETVLIVAPVLYKKGTRFLHHFQELDWLSLVGTTIGSFGWNSPILCSGANLAYKKEVFEAVEGFRGNDHIASGDDIFIMHKILQKYPTKVFFMNAQNATIKTRATDTWSALFHQRIRWAKKTSNLPSLLAFFIGICVFLMNFLLIVLLISSIIDLSLLPLFLLILTIKWFLDFLLLLRASKIFQTEIILKHCIISSLLYPLTSVSIVFLSLFKKYKWKGKTFTK